ncbi:hypothetical protein pb186bvf_019385 [Paramecium bursaria]
MSIIKTLQDALRRLEITADECAIQLKQEQEKRIKITQSVEEAEEQLQLLLNDEDQLIEQNLNIELEKPIQMGKLMQEKLGKKIDEVKYRHTERTYLVDELQYTIQNMRIQYQKLELQLQRSQSLILDLSNNLSQQQSEYLELQITQQRKVLLSHQGQNKEYNDLNEEVKEMKELLIKLKEVQTTLNKVIDKPQNLNKTQSTEEAFKNSFISSQPNQSVIEDQDNNFWYKAPHTPVTKLPRIK